MKKIIQTLVLIASAFLVIGCGGSTTTEDTNTTIPPAPVDGGSGAYQSDISGGGGYVNVEYIIKDQEAIDYLSFFITHYIDGQSYEHYFPSAFSNGSLLRVEAKVYIPSNDTGSTVTHLIEVSYYDNDGQRVVDNYTYSQKPKPAEPAQTVTTSTTI